MAQSNLPTLVAGGPGLARYLQEIRKFPLLAPDEEYMLGKRWQEHGDTDAAHKMVTSHLRLVARIAMGYRGYGLPIGEVISEGNVGLMQAVKKFEPDRGFRLATYAMWWIRASIQEYILRSWSLVKMGTTSAQKKLFFNLRKVKGQIQALEEGELKPEHVKQIATKLGVSEEDVISMNRRLVRRHLAERAVARRCRWRRVAGLAGRRQRQPGDRAGCERGGEPPPLVPEGCRQDAERARDGHLQRPPLGRGAGDAGGTVGQARRQPRAHPANRGARVREGAEGGADRRHDQPISCR